MSEIDEKLRSELQRQGVWVTSMQELYNWGRKNSIWPLQFGLACCAIEMIAIAASSRSHDCRWHGHEENGAADRQALQPDARPKICYFDGRVRNLRRAVQAGLQCAQGHRPLHPGGRLHSRLPTEAGSVAARVHGTAAQDRRSKTDGRWQSRALRGRPTERISGAILWRTRSGAASE